MMCFRERCRTIWFRRVTWRRKACVARSAIQTSGKKAAGIELGQHAGIGLIGVGGLPAPLCSRRPVSQMGSPQPLFPKASANTRGAEIIMPDNGICERFHRTVLDEFYRF